MSPAPLLEIPLFAYSAARGACFSLEYFLLHSLSLALPEGRKYFPRMNVATALEARRELIKLLWKDSRNIGRGLYPAGVLTPESPVEHALRLPKIIIDGFRLFRRRSRGKTTEFDEKAKDYLSELPRYYRRNFHFQSGGYLTERSAQLYEHQVEMLFGGAADAMRRLILPPLREAFGNTDGRGLNFLEIGAGTGRATRFVRMTFPKAKIAVTDLSDPYLKQAEKSLLRFSRIDFMQADGAKLPFQAGQFDAVYSVFLYHEIPLEVRQQILAESRRVLKPGGFVGLVDSLQKGDRAVFDGLLADFPERYHEPFYRNYVSHPMQDLLKEAGFVGLGADTGYFSKVCWGKATA